MRICQQSRRVFDLEHEKVDKSLLTAKNTCVNMNIGIGGPNSGHFLSHRLDNYIKIVEGVNTTALYG